jgi:cation diffusion facilitator family transporter
MGGREVVTARDAKAQGAAQLSLVFNIFQTVLKLLAAYFTGSVSVLSEALHSASDVISSVVSFVSVKAASRPPDEEHPYGHGKIDTLAGLSEAILLFVFALYTIIISIARLFQKAEVVHVDLGLWVVITCAVLASLVMLRVKKVSKQTESFALESNAQHLQVDIVTTLGVVLALLVSKLTGWRYADPVFAIAFALWLSYSAFRMIHRAFHEVIDHKIDPVEMEKIQSILNTEPELLSHHKLRTRHSGAWHYIDLHIVVPRNWTVVEAHALADRIEKRIESELAPAVCTIHVDPNDE